MTNRLIVLAPDFSAPLVHSHTEVAHRLRAARGARALWEPAGVAAAGAVHAVAAAHAAPVCARVRGDGAFGRAHGAADRAQPAAQRAHPKRDLRAARPARARPHRCASGLFLFLTLTLSISWPPLVWLWQPLSSTHL